MVVVDAHVFPGFLTPVLTQLSFQSQKLLSSHASAEVRGEHTPKGLRDIYIGKRRKRVTVGLK